MPDSAIARSGRDGRYSIGLLVGTTVLALVVSGAAKALDQEPAAASSAGTLEFPHPLIGAWDVAPYPCPIDDAAASDTRLEITEKAIHRYEDVADLKEISPISDSPQAWRVLAVSNIAPAEVQMGDIFVVSADHLTITNGSEVTSYIRCR